MELANFFTEHADVHTFIPNLPFMAAGPTEDEEAEEGSEAEADDAESEEAEAAGDAKTAALTDTPASGSGTNIEAKAPPA